MEEEQSQSIVTRLRGEMSERKEMERRARVGAGMMRKGVDVREATHVKVAPGVVEKIVSTWGIGSEGHLAKPSEGGFGVVTETGRHVDMWSARSYLKEEKAAD